MHRIHGQTFQGHGGVALAADVGGDPRAPTVVLLHGGGQTRHSWHGAMTVMLKRGYRVINLDARGHGDSGWSSTRDYSLATLAADLRGVMGSLSEPPAVVGASMGGMTALHAIANESATIARALVMVDIVPQMKPAGVERIIDFLRANEAGFATLEEAAAAVSAYNPHRPRPRDASGLMKNLRRHANGRLHWHWDPAFFRRRETEAASMDFPAHHRNVRLPVLLVRGLLSELVGDTGVEEFRRQLPQLEVIDVAGAGHMVVGDRNDAFNEGVLQFLNRHMPVRGGDHSG